ncbi:MAG: hypothetical protein A4E45_02307 [Methanosaeta sp. PtaB.Bin039]|nr:MAG: hypothetical protein A4E45_02307 [Methanosaeta sp. PtaB.Bin039]
MKALLIKYYIAPLLPDLMDRNGGRSNGSYADIIPGFEDHGNRAPSHGGTVVWYSTDRRDGKSRRVDL